ncbi:MAG: transcriptional regulator [Alphaproteobacteria bacterium]|nr:transcriptional regulator [Alphaproteobacteria bacterium]
MSRPGTPEREFRSRCPIATTLDIVGDRWTLLILRDLILGKQRFSEFLEAPEGITTSVLTDRLARIEAAGLATRKPYQTRPTRYEYRLTKKGRDLAPVLEAISKWANRYYPGTGRVSKQITAR